MSSNALAPFSCSYTSNVAELLTKLECSIAISTYQAGKIVFISPKDEEKLVQLPRSFDKPMGIALDKAKDKMALATRNSVLVFKNSEHLAIHHPKFPNRYDSMYMPQATYHTGPLDIHDLSYGNEKLYGVNTLFSCIVNIDDDYHFTPYWKPKFISKLAGEDRCHLNGMCMEDGLPKYVSAFSQGDKISSWRERVTETGILVNAQTDEIVSENLAMPHSPRLVNNELYVLQSATGELSHINTSSGESTEVCNLGGFVRGMSYHKEFLFIGLSKLRKNSSTFAHLDIAEKANYCAIAIVHLPTGVKVGEIKYNTSVDEIFDIQVLPNKLRPNILNTMTDDHLKGLSIPETSYWAKENTKSLKK